MPSLVSYLLYLLLFITLMGSVAGSYRYRTQKDPRTRALYASRMNIWMGAFLLAVALTQLILFTMSSARLIIAVVFFLVGLYNLFAGLRNSRYYSSKQ